MSKAEERALEAYPCTKHYWNSKPDRNAEAREFYEQGYHQAEKDLELTWEDVKAIFLLVQVEWRPNKNEEEIYQEVLKRFKKERKRINYDTRRKISITLT